MPEKKPLILSAAAFGCGLFSLLLFLPVEPWPWLGMAGALVGVILGRLAKPKTKGQQALALGGVLLAVAAGIGYLVLNWPSG